METFLEISNADAAIPGLLNIQQNIQQNIQRQNNIARDYTTGGGFLFRPQNRRSSPGGQPAKRGRAAPGPKGKGGRKATPSFTK